MLIYKTTNLVNGKIYVGKTKKEKVSDSYLGSGTLMKAAIAKYGKQNFNRVTIDIASDIEELHLKERFWIKFYNSTQSNVGYNIAKGGGDSGPRTHAVRLLISKAFKGKPKSAKHKQSLVEAWKYRKNRRSN